MLLRLDSPSEDTHGNAMPWPRSCRSCLWDPHCAEPRPRELSLLQLQEHLPQITEVPGRRGAGSRHRYNLCFITA